MRGFTKSVLSTARTVFGNCNGNPIIAAEVIFEVIHFVRKAARMTETVPDTGDGFCHAAEVTHGATPRTVATGYCFFDGDYCLAAPVLIPMKLFVSFSGITDHRPNAGVSIERQHIILLGAAATRNM